MITQIAWRNIWRNKRRTFITISAIAFAVFLASFMISFQKGVWDSVIDGAVNQFFGYAQIHGKGYWEDQTIDKAIKYDEQLSLLPDQIAAIEEVVPRIESFALASSGNLTAGALVIGIDPVKEKAMTKIDEKIIQGAYINQEDNSVLVANGLMKKLGLSLDDTLVLISQGYHGVNAAGKYSIKGVFELSLPDLNKRLLYMPLKEAGLFYGAEGYITTLALKMKDKESVSETVGIIREKLSPKETFEVLEWQELMPELVEARWLDEAGGIIVLAILYLLITFAIFGTILMMTKERLYEFGILVAIGMKREKLFSVVWLETIIVGMIGAIVGILISIPIIYYFNINPLHVSIMGEEAAIAYEKFGLEGTLPTTFEVFIFLKQALVIFSITCFLALYPLLVIMRLQPVAAMRA